MPSSTPKQARFMAAVAHGFKPTGTKAPPVDVAKEFNEADDGTAKLKQGMRIRRATQMTREDEQEAERKLMVAAGLGGVLLWQ